MILTFLSDYLIFCAWSLSIMLFWFLKDQINNTFENIIRYFLGYTLVSTIIFILFQGAKIGIPNDYIANLITEFVGITITVILIDRVYQYLNNRNEILFRNLSLRNCKMLIYTYCANWLYIYNSDKNELNDALGKFTNLDEFFKSDEFYEKVIKFNFNEYIVPDKTFAQYYHERFLEVANKFQDIISKYASKLSDRDLILLEHFGGRAYFYTVFAVMKFISEAKFTRQSGNQNPQSIMPFNNSFQEISRDNFNKHFDKLLELIDAYNSCVENEYEEWTIENIHKLHTIKSANANPAIDW
jgi:hypothetical protein